MSDMVTCACCGRSFSWITPAHITKHGMTLSEYKERYPDEPIVGDRIAAIRAQNMKRIRAPDQATSIRMKKKWRIDREYRQRVSDNSRKQILLQWEDPKFVRLQRRLWRRRYRDPAFQKARIAGIQKSKSSGRYYQWTRPEREVRGILKELGVYRSNQEISFLPHRWLPTEGFMANGDFVDERSRLIIHVDGIYWHGISSVMQKDSRLNQWCVNHKWRYLRLTDPGRLKKMERVKLQKLWRRVIHRFLAGEIIALSL